MSPFNCQGTRPMNVETKRTNKEAGGMNEEAPQHSAEGSKSVVARIIDITTGATQDAEASIWTRVDCGPKLLFAAQIYSTRDGSKI